MEGVVQEELRKAWSRSNCSVSDMGKKTSTRANGVVQVVECVPSKHKALCSNPLPQRKERKEKKRKKQHHAMIYINTHKKLQAWLSRLFSSLPHVRIQFCVS
jgi:hypothetical protein